MYGDDWAAKLATQVVDEAAKEEEPGELPADALEAYRASLMRHESAEQYDGRCLRAGQLVEGSQPDPLTGESKKFKFLEELGLLKLKPLATMAANDRFRGGSVITPLLRERVARALPGAYAR